MSGRNQLTLQHRDLHEGQILIFAEDQTPGVIKDYSDPACSGVRASLIDFGLSRLRNADGSIHTAIPGDILDGEGAQWDVYRAMHAEAKDDWETYRPQTNLRVSVEWSMTAIRVPRGFADIEVVAVHSQLYPERVPLTREAKIPYVPTRSKTYKVDYQQTARGGGIRDSGNGQEGDGESHCRCVDKQAGR
jgi:hypothetical protein